MASDKVGLFGDTTVELQQDGKAILQLSGGDAALSGNKTTLYGEMTSQGKTTFKSDVTAETVEMKNLKVNSSFKTPTPPKVSLCLVHHLPQSWVRN